MPNPTSNDARVPAISSLDARFHDLKASDDATSASAWQTWEAEVRAESDTPSGLPLVDLDYATTEVIGLWTTLEGLRTPTLKRLSDTQAAQTAAALDSLSRCAYALLYVMRQDAKENPSGPSLVELNTEGLALRERGLAWCAILESFGKLPVGTAEAVRKGRASYRETAADLQDLWDALSPLRADIAPLQGLVQTPLTDADIDRMGRLSSLIREAIAAPQGPLGWRVALLRLAARFERSYRAAYAALLFHFTLSGDPITIPTFGALRRPSPKPAAAAAAAPSA
jgi:hypothetical protein